jgi:DNA topoisomerase I
VSRLRRSDCSGPGMGRVRRGRGFMFVDEHGDRIGDQPTIDRARALVIPPAWEDVWICLDPRGHLQATGIDAAGRKQYLYHPDWRSRREREKFASMLDFAGALPALRRRVRRDLEGDELDRDRVLALAVRLLDVGCMRIGGEDYAKEHGSHGLTTLLKEHVRVDGHAVSFDFPGKSGQRIEITVRDPVAAELVTGLRRRRGSSGAPLLAFRSVQPTADGSATRSRWRPLAADDVNALIKALAGQSHSAKDFRTWNATVITAVALSGPVPPTEGGRTRAINQAIRTTAAVLGNTATVCRNSYVDPRLLDRYAGGRSIDAGRGPRDERFLTEWRRRARIERAVIELLADA